MGFWIKRTPHGGPSSRLKSTPYALIIKRNLVGGSFYSQITPVDFWTFQKLFLKPPSNDPPPLCCIHVEKMGFGIVGIIGCIRTTGSTPVVLYTPRGYFIKLAYLTNILAVFPRPKYQKNQKKVHFPRVIHGSKYI